MHPGELIGTRYRVERLIAEGGMGRVLAARDLETEQSVAVKVLLPALAKDDEIVKRFLREARAARSITSEHVARILDVGLLDDGVPFLVMEYLDGKDLQAVLDERGPIPHETAVDWVLEACEAIAEAHAQGTVHRDLKPSNLFLAKTPAGEAVKVLDFGISKSLGELQSSLSMTKTSHLLGSPFYMSPEQLKSSRDVDQRTDIWALGVCLHELVSGERPFDAPSLPELSVMILSSTEAPPLRGVPAGLADVVATCLTNDRRARFVNLADFAALAPYGSARGRASAAKVLEQVGLPAERARLAKSNPGAATPPSERGGLAGYDDTLAQDTSPGVTTLRRLRERVPATLVGFALLGVVGIGLIAFVELRKPDPPVKAATDPPPMTATATVTVTAPSSSSSSSEEATTSPPASASAAPVRPTAPARTTAVAPLPASKPPPADPTKKKPPGPAPSATPADKLFGGEN